MNTDKTAKAKNEKGKSGNQSDRPLSWIEVKFCLEVPVKPSAHDGCDGVNVAYRTRIPFVMQPGFMVVAAPGDDFRKVESVYWDEAEGLVIFLAFDENAKLNRLKKCGWQSDD